MPPIFFEIVGSSEILMFRRKIFGLAVGRDQAFEIYRKISEHGPPTLQVPRRLWLIYAHAFSLLCYLSNYIL